MKFYLIILFTPLLYFIMNCGEKPLELNSNQNTSTLYWKALSLGNAHTCGITNLDTVQCFGSNWKGQLGVGPTDFIASKEPHKIKDLSKIKYIVSDGSDSQCSVNDRGQAYCWGRNDHGQLGLGNNEVIYKPIHMNRGIDGIQYVFMSYFGGYLIDNDGKAYKFGQETNFGDNLYKKPVLDRQFSQKIKQIGQSFPERLVYYLNEKDELFCDNKSVFTPAKKFKLLRVEGNSICVISDDNQLYCKGDNSKGELGLGNKKAVKGFTFINIFNRPVKDISLGFKHTCALTIDGDIYCFGANKQGELGTNDKISSYLPKKVTILNGKKARSIYCLGEETCTITLNNEAYCWGHDQYHRFGQTKGSGSYMTPVLLPHPSS